VVSDPLRELFHRLNNQLGVILANAELIEARAADDLTRARAAQVVESAVQAMAAVRELRSQIERDS
jgi:two-component sensor histidine kinase